MEKTPADAVSMIKQYYASLPGRLADTKIQLGRAMTLAEKVLFAHWQDDGNGLPERGISPAQFWPDRVAMQDATAQMALLQFMSSGRKKVAVPSTVHCDHLIQAEVGAKDDLAAEGDKNNQQDKTATTAGAGYSPSKAKTVLKPIKYHIQHKKFKQTSKAALLSIHVILLFNLPIVYTIIIEKGCR